MKIARTRRELAEALDQLRVTWDSVNLVPTMGALHEGHVSLLRAARDSGAVALSIFVNPLQFGPREDYRAYPRDEGRDLERAEAEDVDLVFAPSVDDMLGSHPATTVSVGRLAAVVEGDARPGHFDGVATIVATLFNLVHPERAFFGQKDAQQVAVIKKMVADLGFSVELVVCPTAREPDGLAKSSRNAYLSDGDRARASVLWEALRAGRNALSNGRDLAGVEEVMVEAFRSTPGVEPGYARAVNPDTFERSAPGGPVLLVVAATVGGTRLIDNLLVEQPFGGQDAVGG
ncbi:MAG: pantoate--beta-alanine ligase [Actinomycetota bacterium]|nr:pantoate--beta-alanine ligase [Actinomycetota bacterium]